MFQPLRGGVLTAAVLLVFWVVPLPADDDSKEATKKKKPAKPRDEYAVTFAYPKAVKLDEKQKEQVEGLRKEYVPKLTKQDKEFNAIMTAERQKAANEARKKASADGKKRGEVNKAYNDALKLTDEEKKQLASLRRERTRLLTEINKKKNDLLTDEQKEALKPKPRKP